MAMRIDNGRIRSKSGSKLVGRVRTPHLLSAASLLLGGLLVAGCMPSQPAPGSSGTSAKTISVNGTNRTYLLHVPANLDRTRPVPLLFVMHGFTMSGEIMEGMTGFDDVADSNGFVVAYPDGAGANPWNVGAGVCGAGAAVNGTGDDIQFVKDMIDAIDQVQAIDRSEVFLTGFSMGGYFAHNIGCQEGHNLLRAVADHSGGTYPGLCPGAPEPILMLHGTGDGLIDVNCDKTARDYWAQRNGCSTGVDMVPIMGGHCEISQGCPPGGQVELCLFDNMAHGWAGASTSGTYGAYGGGTQYQSATQLVWDFFKQQM